ncbi:MAG: Uncharacterised protein [Gammaproteobacteria bacterium]|nr:MAG: Uncharacterised protein [Gammaproteobacteria bacterium]
MVKAAMTKTNTGKRIASSTRLRMRLMDPLDSTNTNRVASPSPIAFSSVLETANSGHSPSSWINPGFRSQRPSSHSVTTFTGLSPIALDAY